MAIKAEEILCSSFSRHERKQIIDLEHTIDVDLALNFKGNTFRTYYLPRSTPSHIIDEVKRRYDLAGYFPDVFWAVDGDYILKLHPKRITV